MRKGTGNGRPLNPKINQLWWEPASRSMRRWDGKKWAETTKDDVRKAIAATCDQDQKEDKERIHGQK